MKSDLPSPGGRNFRPASPRVPAVVCPPLLGLALLMILAPCASAQTLRPWVPPGADTLVRQIAEAKVRFRGNAGDSIGGSNYRAYEIVGEAGRRLLRSLGPRNLLQAPAVEALLDSLGLDTDVRVDPELPKFVLLMVRNPYHLQARSVGFLYWYKENDLRMQGAQFTGGMEPNARVWWTGDENAPYSWGIVDVSRKDKAMHLTLLRLAPSGNFWGIVQYEDSGFLLGSTGATYWADINGDRRPELLVWMATGPDSLFEECVDCPKVVSELVFAERQEGLRLQDTRIVPSPQSIFHLFVRLLADNKRVQAARLLESPALLEKAIAAGWGARHPRLWKVESWEPGTTWPEWLVVRFHGPRGDRRYTVDFALDHGRWVIRNWTAREIAPAGPGGKPAPKTGRP